MQYTPTPYLVALPVELLCLIVPLLSTHDLSICTRVNKAWHDAFIDSLWHTVKLGDIGFGRRAMFDHIKQYNGPYLDIDDEEIMVERSPFLRNLHRIRVLSVSYMSYLNLFWEQDSTQLQTIPLEDLSIDFEDDPKPITPLTSDRHVRISSPEIGFLGPTDMRAVLQILKRSTRLSAFSFVAGTSARSQLSSFSFVASRSPRALLLENQAHLLASLPASVKKMNMTMDGFLRPVFSFQVEKPQALKLFLKLKSKGSFESLTMLSVIGSPIDLIFLTALLEHSLKLQELIMDISGASWDDDLKLANILSKVSSPGWKTLEFKRSIGPLTVATILECSVTLENLRLENCGAFDSKAIQTLLCSAPNLKRLDCIEYYGYRHVEPSSLMAMDIVESKEDWVCLGLETFKCYIGGVPRPDITTKENGGPLTSIYNDKTRFSELESRAVQRQVLAQLGRLTKLREITLGRDELAYDDDGSSDNEYYSSLRRERGFQYQCLTMSLEDGLDELKDLKCLQKLTLENMSLRMGEAEQTWMKENWPEYGKK